MAGPWGKEAVLAGAEISGKQLWGMEELSPQVPRPEGKFHPSLRELPRGLR